MRLSKARRKYRGNWIAFKFTDEKKREGKVLFHTKDKQAVFNKPHNEIIKKNPGLYLTFCGPIIPRGMSILLGAVA